MNREAVESSTMKAVGYVVEARILEIEFESGAVYRYRKVPAETYEGLMSAESKGKYFNSEIRNCYEYERVIGAGRGG